ncbi:MAG: phosphoribosylformylglycinamidine synthase subunit PurL [Bacillota bacterium]
MTPEDILEAKAWRTLGLRDSEYQEIREVLGRLPNWVEVGMFSVLWSEHCGYKHSRPCLRDLPTEGPRVLVGPGENAGVVDIGDGLAVAFRIESHNHPIAVEPYQGAATGIGGIVRDILAVGARPVALLDSLRFGDPGQPRARYIFQGVVSGISGYGNCIGVPTVGGEVFFDDAYDRNPLCNVMCVGLVDSERVASARARGEGNAVVLVGALTGRDGLGGASFASEELGEDTEAKRPAVQVGDPFMEKLLIEACLEMLEKGAVSAIQDMGAAGITSSCAETAARGGLGMDIDVSRVPLREPGMTPFEIMLSESQERMLIIAEKGKEGVVEAIAMKWGLCSSTIGTLTGDGMLRVREKGEVVGEVPARALAEEAPTYTPEAKRPSYLDQVQGFDPEGLPVPADLTGVLLGLMESPNVASKEMVWTQYDHMVRTDTVGAPGGDAAVLRVKGTRKGLSLATDGNGRYTYLDPWTGGALAVAEAARNVACSGAIPVALTNCLNFPNPEKPEVYWQFCETVRGMGDACRALGIPVTGGNVSFYNETEGKPIYPTPIVGVLGLLEDIDARLPAGFQSEGDLIGLLGLNLGELGGSEYLRLVHDVVSGRPPRLDLELEGAVQAALAQASGLLRSAHDCSDGGLAVALAECCLLGRTGPVGATVNLKGSMRPDALLFGESASRVVISFSGQHLPALKAVFAQAGAPFTLLGQVAGARLVITGDGTLVDCTVGALEERWRNGLRWAVYS